MSKPGHLEAVFDLEMKADAEGATGVIEGYASYFNERDGGNDIVMPGAFAKSLRERRKASGAWHIPMFLGHVHNGAPVGVWNEISEDARGLKVKGQLIFESDEAKQLYAVMKAGGAMGLSIGYRTLRQEFETPKPKADEYCPTIRRLLEVDLREISLVGMPMLDSARVTKVKGEGVGEGGAGESAPVDEAKAQGDALIRALADLNVNLAVSNALDRALHDLG